MTPDSLPLPPRPVRLQPRRGWWLNRISQSLCFAFGLGMIVYLSFLILWQLFGADHPATITRTTVTHSSKGRTYYHLHYQFDLNGQPKSGSDSVDFDIYENFQSVNLPCAATARYFSLGPFHYSGLHESGSFWDRTEYLVIATLVFNGFLSVVFYNAWIKPVRTRRLYQNGQAAPGVIVRKWEVTGKNTDYYIAYSFNHPTTGQSYEKELEIDNAEAWRKIEVGQPVTVLFSPDRPQHNTVYEYGGYEFVRVSG